MGWYLPGILEEIDMAHTEPLPEDTRLAIARQLGTHLPKLELPEPPSGPVKTTYEMYVSYPIYTFDWRVTTGSLRDLATHTGRWHHQLRRVLVPPGGTPSAGVIGYATSRVFGPSPTDWQIVSISGSAPASKTGPDVDLASEIDGAGDWIDNYIPGDPTLRLLILTSLFLYTFWLLFADHDDIVVIDMPEAFELAHKGPFEYQVAYPSQNFRNNLQHVKPVRGLSPFP
jgi:hypothetical protein